MHRDWGRRIILGVAGPNQPDDTRRDDAAEDAQIRTFLIADVRGYTLFTQERGDEAAAKLAAKFADPQFRCGGFGNPSGLCSESLDAEVDDAQRLQATDPGAANRAWAEIEHQLVEDAIWAPLTNPVSAYALSARTENVQIHPSGGSCSAASGSSSWRLLEVAEAAEVLLHLVGLGVGDGALLVRRTRPFAG
jgi:ABC-type transport system substrate-binding protein